MKEKLEATETALKEWKKDFFKRTGRNPTQIDMNDDENAKQLFSEYSRLSRITKKYQ